MALSRETRRNEFAELEGFGAAQVFKCAGRVSGVEIGSTAGGELFVIPSHCGSEACPTCGTDGSFFHMRRAARVARAIGGARARVHLTLTLAPRMADLADPWRVGLELADEVARGILRAAYRLCREDLFPEREGWFARLRLHWAGDPHKNPKGSDRCRIHVHILAGHDEDLKTYKARVTDDGTESEFMAYRRLVLKKWNRRVRAFFREREGRAREAGDLDLARLLEGARRDQVKDFHYRPIRSDAAWVGAIAYETGPRLRNLWPWNPERWADYLPGDRAAVEAGALYAQKLYEVFAHGFPPSRWYGRSSRQAPELPRPETTSDRDTAAVEAAILRELESQRIRGADGAIVRVPGRSLWTGLPITWEHVSTLAADTFALWGRNLAPVVPLPDGTGILYQGPDPDLLSAAGVDPMVCFEAGRWQDGRSGP